MQKMKSFISCTKNNRRKSFFVNKRKKEGETAESGNISDNNRQLATALSKARLQIRELESEKVRLCGERHQLMENVSALTSEIEKYRRKDDGTKANSKILVKEVSKSLHTQLEKTTEMLLQCSTFLTEAVESVGCLQAISSEISSKNLSTCFARTPLNIFSPNTDAVIQTNYSEDPALSLTAMTPSISSASSDNDDSLSSGNGNDNQNVLPDEDEIYCPLEIMDIDMPNTLSSPDSIIMCCTPNLGLTKGLSSVVCKLAVTPEECEDHPTHAQLSNTNSSITWLSSPSSPAGQRVSKRRNVRQNFCYKEPSLTRKLRQGDPFTDFSLYSPGYVRLGKQRQHAKRKSKQRIEKVGKRVKNDDDVKDASNQPNDEDVD